MEGSHEQGHFTRYESKLLFIHIQRKKLDLIKIKPLSSAFDIAKKISFSTSKSYTGIIVKLAMIATSISVAAIILTLSIVNGFQYSISNKVFSFWGHIRIESVNGRPLPQNDSLIQHLKLQNKELIQNITPFIHQSTVIGYQKEIEGVVAKGISAQEPIPFLIKESTIIDSHQHHIIISDVLARKLNIDLHKNVKLYFLNGTQVQQRSFKVTGIYHSGIDDYDQKFIMVPLIDLQQLQNNNASIPTVDGYTITLRNADNIDSIKNKIQSQLPSNWVSTTIPNYYPQIFDWIGVQNINRNVAITIMLLIAIINLVTCLFILMLERIPIIGSFSAMGASHGFIRKIFMYQASFIAWTGILTGCLVGIGLSLLQLKFGWIQLDESAYFVKTLPIKIVPLQIIGVMLGTAVISYISFLLPTLWVKRISPASAIRFD
jgi:lipoprotein-releasing system permease protein